MIKILLSGAAGRMGRAVASLAADREDTVIVGGIDPVGGNADFPIVAKPELWSGECDAVVDFSNASGIYDLLDWCVKNRVPAVISTTGMDEAAIEAIKKASREIAIFRSANMSLGVSLLKDLAARAAKLLGEDFDVEIIERHHNRKLDAPSGTALILADAIAAQREESRYVYDRHSVRRARESSEIGIHSVRGGTIIGEHEVLFAGANERISLSHSAESREVFAAGALHAAAFIVGREPGLYNMDDLVASL